MARGKHATALFEVIHSSRMPNKPVLVTPKWWFKRHDKRSADMTSIAAASNSLHDTSATPFHYTEPTTSPEPVSAAPPVVHPATARATCGVPAHERAAATIDTDVDMADEPSSVHNSSIANRVTELKPPVARSSGQPNIDDVLPASVDDSIDESTSADHGAKRSGLAVKVDAHRHLIRFQLSYSNAIITAFSLLVVVSLAFAIGKRLNAGSSLSVASATSDQIRNKPARPDVLNITPPGAMASRTTKTNPVAKPDLANSSQVRDPEVAISSATGDNDPSKPNGNSKTDAAAGTTPGATDRQIGLNYVVIQSYPDEKSASDARDLLIKNGVACTVERALRGLPPAWSCIVGTEGFARISSPECQDYCHKIDQISKQIAQNKRGFKPAQLMQYKWDKAKS